MRRFAVLALVPLLALAVRADQSVEDPKYPLHEAALIGAEEFFRKYIKDAREENPFAFPVPGE